MMSQELVTSKYQTLPKITMEMRGRVFERQETLDFRPGGQFRFPAFLFFFKKLKFLFLASLRFFFFCKCNTDAVMSAYKRRLQICFRVGSAAG